MRSRTNATLIVCLCLGAPVLAGACSDEPVDSDRGREGAESQPDLAPADLPPACPTVSDLVDDRPTEPGAAAVDFSRVAGRWRGAVLNDARYFGYAQTLATFPTGEVVLSLGADGSGTIAFGWVPNVDTNSDLGPPPDPDPFLCAGAPSTGCTRTQEILARFEYRLGRAAVLGALPDESPAIQVALWRSEPWQAWCEAQAPRRIPGECFAPGDACLGPAACDTFTMHPDPSSVDLNACSMSDGTITTPVACDWLAALNDAPCACADGGCVAQGLALTLTLGLEDGDQTLRGSVLEAPDGARRPQIELQRAD
jgi:hypothetical protein